MRLTADFLKDNAEANPEKIAVIDGALEITYGEFERDLGNVIHGLQQFNLPKGSHVAVEWTQIYPHWLLLLACEQLGWVSFSYGNDERDLHHAYLLTMDFIIAPIQIPNSKKIPYHLLSDAWIDSLISTDKYFDIPNSPLRLDDYIRVQCSSGTTGSQKFMKKSVQANQFRITHLNTTEGINEKTRLIICNGFHVQGAYRPATACLQAGGTVIFHNGNIIQMIQSGRATHGVMLPFTLQQILEVWPKNSQKPDKFTLCTFGGKVTKNTRNAVEKYMTSKIVECYATNETGYISSLEEGTLGTILPYVTVEIIDASGQHHLNQAGIIRIKSEGVLSGYINDEAATAQNFKDGWFYPGDTGIMPDPLHLQILGRVDELINIGGIKKNPADIEDELRPHFEVDDFCLIKKLTTSDGPEQGPVSVLWIALVKNEKTDMQKIQHILSQVAAKVDMPLKIQLLPVIPRTHSGKVKKETLLSVLGSH